MMKLSNEKKNYFLLEPKQLAAAWHTNLQSEFFFIPKQTENRKLHQFKFRILYERQCVLQNFYPIFQHVSRTVVLCVRSAHQFSSI